MVLTLDQPSVVSSVNAVTAIQRQQYIIPSLPSFTVAGLRRCSAEAFPKSTLNPCRPYSPGVGRAPFKSFANWPQRPFLPPVYRVWGWLTLVPVQKLTSTGMAQGSVFGY